jgi:3-phenylpropionate/trans-cinnamate dioxygenase ferredoxin reductase subunit
MHFQYVIVGGGHAGAAAVEGIRSQDPTGSVLMLSRDNHPPYDRPALSKGLWFGKTTKDQLPLHDAAWYRDQNVQVELRREVVELDTAARTIWDDRGMTHQYEKLLIATGARPRRLDVEGADNENIHYYRSLEDYLFFEQIAHRLQHVLVLGSGFIGMEMAAALRHAGMEVTLLYHDEYPLHRVLPRELGLFVADYYRERGIETISGESIARFEDHGSEQIALTMSGNEVRTQIVLVGAGVEPSTELAEAAGLEIGNGIEVDEYARTSDPHVYAAGDVAEFPYLALEKQTRIEHWDHAVEHGKVAGANMAGANRPYTTLPMFFSDLFDLGWEAVGEVDGSLVTHAVWRERFREGVVFYLQDDVIRGALLWNVFNKVDWARQLIREAKPMDGAEREQLVHAMEHAS